MMSPITPAALLRTFSSMSLSCMIVLITPPIASIALSTRPRLAAFSSSIRASSSSRALTYFCATASTSSSCLLSTSRAELVEAVAEVLLGVLADLLEVLRQLRDVLGDLGAAFGDPAAGLGQLGADDVGDLADHDVHRLQVAGLALLVEGVDLARHPHQLVLDPAALADEAAVALVLVRAHAVADVLLERLAGLALAVVERAVDLAVEAVEDRRDVGLRLRVDRLDVGGDLGPLLLVDALRVLLVADRLGERLDA